MKAIIIDDNLNARMMLQSALSELMVISEVHSFNSCSAAMQWMQDHSPDVVLMECVVENSSTISVASDIKKQYPNCKVIFCTAYPYFALDAFQIHASGYLLKPITTQKLREEIDYVIGYTSPRYLIKAKCFGNFEVSAYNQPLLFKRSKTKELLALLIKYNGEGITSKEICNYLWNSEHTKHINYLYQLFDDLRNSLRKVNAEKVLVKNGIGYAVNPELIACDYYSYLNTGYPCYQGKFMMQYSWAKDFKAFSSGESADLQNL